MFIYRNVLLYCCFKELSEKMYAIVSVEYVVAEYYMCVLLIDKCC